ncbi:MAG: hypothetical protein R3C20_20430 [Planctomycetaceae bacterium]
MNATRLKRPQYLARGCTCVICGLTACLNLVAADQMVLALLLTIATAYPGFAMIGLAIWPD